ncbi:MAG: type II toxin-antitoxin system VapB family antitoxin [Armatimonadetes bacterium]|nr:type II toxin-antitoxin system VapB family antitoxin [Armatimonadota bacterium]
MRTTVDVDKATLQEAMKLANVRTQKEAINLALEEFVRRRRLERLAAMIGTYEIGLTPEELKRIRAQDIDD